LVQPVLTYPFEPLLTFVLLLLPLPHFAATAAAAVTPPPNSSHSHTQTVKLVQALLMNPLSLSLVFAAAEFPAAAAAAAPPPPQTGNLVQALLMNPSRCRRRLRRGLEDWSNLYQHALNADVSPGFQAYMTVHGWKWTPAHPEEIAVSVCVWGGGVEAGEGEEGAGGGQACRQACRQVCRQVHTERWCVWGGGRM
jgi:hypothetical protein